MIHQNKLALDLDGVICDFFGQYCKWFKIDPTTVDKYDIEDAFFDNMRELIISGRNEEFYLTMDVLEPYYSQLVNSKKDVIFITARNKFVSKEITQQWLNLNKVPHLKMYQTTTTSEKISILNDLIGAYGSYYMVEDSPDAYIQMKAANIDILLLDQPYNRNVDAGSDRIKELSPLLTLF